METYLLIFTCLMAAVLLVAIGNLILEIVKTKKGTATAATAAAPAEEKKEEQREEKKEAAACLCDECAMASACEAEQANVSCESEPEQPAADPVAEAAPTVAIDENTVVFAKVEKAGYADQLKDLPADQKELYKQLKEHIATFGDTKEIVANKYETVNYKGRNLLVRIQIRKAQLLLKFELPNEQLNAYAKTSNDKFIKEKLFEIRVNDEASLKTALKVTDIARERIDTEIEKKKEERRARRRAAAAKK